PASRFPRDPLWPEVAHPVNNLLPPLTTEPVRGFTIPPMVKNTGGGFSSGELARLTGVSVDTLRHYENKGVLPRPPRGANAYRRYPAEAVDRVRLIRGALEIGFTLDELGPILAARDAGRAPCRTVRTMAAGKLQDLEERIAVMIASRDDLRRLIDEWDHKLEAVPEGMRAGLLDSLARAEARATHHQPINRRLR
ncbi:MAG TPA: heavy metal-responsive transcriptional regulator, partial [Thermoanaerobaculia bacterium]|nr:heavy metal-responsive transcriptional regulator [Thermoanaerobaculia bacterium]